jgi:DNA adenine methylase
MQTPQLALSRPFKSPLRYPGGKQKAIAQIAARLPQSALEYREPMVGGGSVFLHARSSNLAKSYWINDQFPELVSFWRTLQDERLCRRLMTELEELRQSFADASEIKKYFLSARSEPCGADSYRDALLFFFFNRVTFSGTTRAGGFSSSASLRRFTASSVARLQPMAQALSQVRITQLDFEDVVSAPGSDVFLFLDPPYFTANRLYGRNGSLHAFDHERLCRALKDSPHRFLITYDDCPEIRRLYRWAKVESWELQYGMNNCNSERLSKIGSELFISNYRPPASTRR